MHQTAAKAAMMHDKSDESRHGVTENCQMRYVVCQRKHAGHMATVALHCYCTDSSAVAAA